MKRFGFLFVMACALALAPSARAGDVLKISGGGMATFDFFDGGTIFSVQAEIAADGSVKGQFFCAIPSIVTVNGTELVEAIRNDDGSVDLYGIAHGYDAAVGTYQDMPFALRIWPGGPGVGGFIYDDPVVGPSGGVDLNEGDQETVSNGHIMFQ